MQKTMKVVGLVGVLALLLSGCLSAGTLTFSDVGIPGGTNLFSAGGGPLAGGTAAVQASFAAAGNQVLQFSSVTGASGFCNALGCGQSGPDGGPVPTGWSGTNILAVNSGLSG